MLKKYIKMTSLAIKRQITNRIRSDQAVVEGDGDDVGLEGRFGRPHLVKHPS